MTPESKVKAKVKAVLKAYGVYYCMPLGTVWGKSGVPDIIACPNGHFLGIETKAGRGKCTKLQEIEHSKIHSSGGTVLVIRETNIDTVAQVLEEMGCTKLETTS